MAEDRMRIIKATKATWVDDSQTAINCWVITDDGQELPFTATSVDSEPHGRDVFNALCANNLADYTAPVANIAEML